MSEDYEITQYCIESYDRYLTLIFADSVQSLFVSVLFLLLLTFAITFFRQLFDRDSSKVSVKYKVLCLITTLTYLLELCFSSIAKFICWSDSTSSNSASETNDGRPVQYLSGTALVLHVIGCFFLLGLFILRLQSTFENTPYAIKPRLFTVIFLFYKIVALTGVLVFLLFNFVSQQAALVLGVLVALGYIALCLFILYLFVSFLRQITLSMRSSIFVDRRVVTPSMRPVSATHLQTRNVGSFSTSTSPRASGSFVPSKTSTNNVSNGSRGSFQAVPARATPTMNAVSSVSPSRSMSALNINNTSSNTPNKDFQYGPNSSNNMNNASNNVSNQSNDNLHISSMNNVPNISISITAPAAEPTPNASSAAPKAADNNSVHTPNTPQTPKTQDNTNKTSDASDMARISNASASATATAQVGRTSSLLANFTSSLRNSRLFGSNRRISSSASVNNSHAGGSRLSVSIAGATERPLNSRQEMLLGVIAKQTLLVVISVLSTFAVLLIVLARSFLENSKNEETEDVLYLIHYFLINVDSFVNCICLMLGFTHAQNVFDKVCGPCHHCFKTCCEKKTMQQHAGIAEQIQRDIERQIQKHEKQVKRDRSIIIEE